MYGIWVLRTAFLETLEGNSRVLSPEVQDPRYALPGINHTTAWITMEHNHELIRRHTWRRIRMFIFSACWNVEGFMS